ncbi:MAG: hypothetical protein E7Z87_02240 [Cyanobacteria bacterium SIG26]|nr:hypothetical protein [Cyanobacteria bacterium SIG26]
MINGIPHGFNDSFFEDMGRNSFTSPFGMPYFGVGSYMPYGCNRDAFTLSKPLPDMQKVTPSATRHKDKNVWASVLTGAALLLGGAFAWKTGGLQKAWKGICTFCSDLITKFKA